MTYSHISFGVVLVSCCQVRLCYGGEQYGQVILCYGEDQYSCGKVKSYNVSFWFRRVR